MRTVIFFDYKDIKINANSCINERKSAISFRIGLSTSPSDTAKDFSSTKNVKGMHVLFTPERYKDRNTGVLISDMYSRCNIMELPKNAVVDEDDAENGEVVNP